MSETYHKTFTSPINEDNGREHRFIGHAGSEMALQIRPLLQLRDGGFQDSGKIWGQLYWTYTMLDGVHKGRSETRLIRLWFNGTRLVQFGGVFEMPDEAIELLESNGFDATMAKL